MKNEWDNFWSDRNVKVSWSKKRIIKILERYVKSDMIVLDAGCGSGFFSKFFIDKGCKVFALDYSNNALDMTRKRTENLAKRYVSADLLDSNLPGKLRVRFDIIFSDGLLEHFPQNEQFKIMYNFKRMKKGDGILINFVPSRASFWQVIRPFMMPGISEKPFSLKRLIELHKSIGLEIVDAGGINVVPSKISPEFLGSRIGMLLYTAAK